MRAYQIFEKFKDESDPIEDMHIGLNVFDHIKKGDVICDPRINVYYVVISINRLNHDSANILNIPFGETSTDANLWRGVEDAKTKSIYIIQRLWNTENKIFDISEFENGKYFLASRKALSMYKIEKQKNE
jgi:hypothetical protein